MPEWQTCTLIALEGFDIEDDGSTECQLVVDLIAMISAAIGGQDIGVSPQTALRSYLEGMRNVLGNIYALEAGKPISYEETMRRLATDGRWGKAVDFVQAL
jgi:hypothetical protein